MMMMAVMTQRNRQYLSYLIRRVLARMNARGPAGLIDSIPIDRTKPLAQCTLRFHTLRV